MARGLAVGLVALGVWAGGGCGGGGGGGPVTADDFAEAGNKICREGDDELAEASAAVLAAKQDKRLSLEETAAFFSAEALPIARKRLDELADLKPPATQQESLDDLVAAGREAVAEIERGLREDPNDLLAASGANPFAEFDALAGELGLTGCVGRTGDREEPQRG